MEAPKSVSIDKVQLVKAYHKAWMSTPVEITGEWVNELVLFHELQLDPVSDHVIHVDFLAVNKDEKVSAEVPVVLVGVSPYEKSWAGKVSLVKDAIEVEALPLDLPHDIEIDISWIESVNDVIHVSDLKVSDNVEILDDPELTLVTVSEFSAQPEEDEDVAVEVGDGTEGEEQSSDETTE